MSYNLLPHFSGGMLQLIDEVKQQKKAYNALEGVVRELAQAVAKIEKMHIDEHTELAEKVAYQRLLMGRVDDDHLQRNKALEKEIQKLKEAYGALLMLQRTDETWKFLSQAQERHGKPVKLRQGAFDSFHGESKSE